MRGSVVGGAWDQGAASSCVAFALARAINMAHVRAGDVHAPAPSPMWLYYAARAQLYAGAASSDIVLSDSGSYPRLAMKAVQAVGFCSWDSWQYDAGRVSERPPLKSYGRSYDQRGLKYWRINDAGQARVNAVSAALSLGMPVIFAAQIDEAFSYHDGMRPVRALDPSKLRGRHMMTAVAVEPGAVVLVNSWGPNWADMGYGKLAPSFFGDPAMVDDVYAVQAAPLWSKR